MRCPPHAQFACHDLPPQVRRMQNEVRRVRQSDSCMDQAKIALTPLYQLPALKVCGATGGSPTLLGAGSAPAGGGPSCGGPAPACPPLLPSSPFSVCSPHHHPPAPSGQNYSSNSTVALLAEAAAEATGFSKEAAPELGLAAEPAAEPGGAAAHAVGDTCSAAAAPLASCGMLDSSLFEGWQAQAQARQGGEAQQPTWAWPGTPAALPAIDYREAAEAVCACLADAPATAAGEGCTEQRCSGSGQSDRPNCLPRHLPSLQAPPTAHLPSGRAIMFCWRAPHSHL